MRIAYNIRKYSEFDLPSRYTFSQKMFKNNAINNNFIFGQLKAHEMMQILIGTNSFAIDDCKRAVATAEEAF